MQTLSQRLEKLSRLKGRNQSLFSPLLDVDDSELMPYDVSDSGLTRSDLRDKIRKIHSCAGLLEFRADYKPDADGTLTQEIKLHNATFCRHYTVCEICSRRVQLTRWKRFRAPVENLVAKYPHVYHVTFTIEDKANLGERIDFLQSSFRSFVRAGQRRGRGRSRGEWSKVGAAIVATENKRGECSDLWHAHKHALLFCREMLDFRVYDQDKVKKLEKVYGYRKVPKEKLFDAAVNVVDRNGTPVAVSKLSGEWLAATGGQGISVDARRLKGNVAEVAKEVLKYPVKVSLKSKFDIPYIIEQTYNRRFLSTYGDLRGLAVDSYTLDETAESKEIYLSQWSGFKYGDLTPGRAIESTPLDVKKRLMSRMARAVGTYRRQRRAALVAWGDVKVKVLSALAADLDRLKVNMRAEVAALVQHFSRMPDVSSRLFAGTNPAHILYGEQMSLDLSPAPLS